MHGTSGMAETTGPGAGCTLVGSAGGMSTGGTSPPGISPPSIPLRISLISPRIKKLFNGKILSQRQTLQLSQNGVYRDGRGTPAGVPAH